MKLNNRVFNPTFLHFPPESTDSNWRARILKAFIAETVLFLFAVEWKLEISREGNFVYN